jgi:hypothetical protein
VYEYRHFVDKGMFLDAEQSTGAFSGARRTGIVCPPKKDKKAVFPLSTKCR